MWIYSQSSGNLNSNNKLIAVGYSGHEQGKNNYSFQNVIGIGPCPVGLFNIGEAYDHPKLGPITMDLFPDEHNEMFGRDAFRIHADSIEHPGAASEGCICLNRATRLMISSSKDRKLVVIP
jgi:hypothetical protein